MLFCHQTAFLTLHDECKFLKNDGSEVDKYFLILTGEHDLCNESRYYHSLFYARLLEHLIALLNINSCKNIVCYSYESTNKYPTAIDVAFVYVVPQWRELNEIVVNVPQYMTKSQSNRDIKC